MEGAEEAGPADAAVPRQCHGSDTAVIREGFGRECGGESEQPFWVLFLVHFFLHDRATRTRVFWRDSLFCVHSCAWFASAGLVSVWHDLHTFWRLADVFSRIPSVSAALWAA